MEPDLYQIARAVARAFYYVHDDYLNGFCFWVERVFPSAEGDAYNGTCIAYNERQERWYRVGYTFDPAARPDDEDTPRYIAQVAFAPEETWEEVEWVWAPVAGDGERGWDQLNRRKLALILRGLDPGNDDAADVLTRRLPGQATPQLGAVQHRTVRCEVRRTDGEARTTLIINTADLDSHRTIVDPAGGEWDEFRGRFFINHDLNLLAGFSPEPRMEGGNWVVTIDDAAWDHDDPEVERWFGKVKRGLCDEVSLGFRPVEGRWETVNVEGREERVFRYTRWKGLEWSFVGMGSNPGAVVTERARPSDDEPPTVSTETPAPAEERGAPAVRQIPLSALRAAVERKRADRRQRAHHEALKRLGRA